VPVDFVFHRPTGSHCIRCGILSQVAMAGVPLQRIRELLGHKSIVTTERYSSSWRQRLEPYYAEFAQAVAPGVVQANPAQQPSVSRVETGALEIL
jgi:hypothetical protein